MEQNLTAPSRFMNDQSDKEPPIVDRTRMNKDFTGIKNKLKMDKIDARVEKEYVLNTQYTS